MDSKVLQILQDAYKTLAANPYPGHYIDFKTLLDTVNEQLSAQNLPIRTEEQLKEIINELFPWARYEEDYKYDRDDTHLFSPLAIRINNIDIPHLPISDGKKQKCTEELYPLLANLPLCPDGWYALSDIGSILARGGFSSQQYGYDKMTHLLRDVIPEFKTTTRQNAEGQDVLYGYLGAVPNVGTGQPFRPRSTNKLFSFAYFPDFDKAMAQLAKMALPESWSYGTKDSRSRTILKNYFHLTFERLQAEDQDNKDNSLWAKKIMYNDHYAVFNTGLVDTLYEPIYAILKTNGDYTPTPWTFYCFAGSREKEHQLLIREFGSELPKPARYYNSTTELVFNPDAKIGAWTWDHFFDHCERLPEDFLKTHVKDFNWDRPRTESFYSELSDTIKNNALVESLLKDRIKASTELALKRVRWNFKTGIPIYYPAQKKISILLPLALCDNETVDNALVLEATDSGAYIAHTLLSLEMAYTDARLITRPDSDWLITSHINAKKQTDAPSTEESNNTDAKDAPIIEKEKLKDEQKEQNKERIELPPTSVGVNQICFIEQDEDGLLHIGNVLVWQDLKVGGRYLTKKIVINTQEATKEKYPYFLLAQTEMPEQSANEPKATNTTQEKPSEKRRRTPIIDATKVIEKITNEKLIPAIDKVKSTIKIPKFQMPGKSKKK